ncbi:pyridoxamine 5'-phosphate oxidase family protein [Nocardia sp. NPDC004068]|uniref:pyridoxamine 5'-phosphate oxidase family protein n=1 Tax=Nocardia sp. NPDC004068 TaxID=3364303 RepID=UPI0036750D57
MRRLHDAEIEQLLSSDALARVATVDAEGFPHVTPLWFVWAAGTFYLTSYVGRPHLNRIARNPRVGLVIDVEAALRPDGERPNKQIRVIGDATVAPDPDNVWTDRIRAKYLGATLPKGRAGRGRALVTLTPRELTAVASV